MLLRAYGGNHYSQLKVTMEGGLNGIVNEINKEMILEDPPPRSRDKVHP
jgi:hypothetical protein